MKALAKLHSEKGIWMTDCDLPTVGHNDLLIKIHKTAICGTDMHIYQWDEWAQNTIPVPMVVGHEYVGFRSHKVRYRPTKVKNASILFRCQRPHQKTAVGGRNAPLNHEHIRHFCVILLRDLRPTSS